MGTPFPFMGRQYNDFMILGVDASQANRKQRSGTEWYAFYLIEEFKRLLGGRSGVKVRLYVRGALRSDLANNLPENFEVHILRWPFRFLWGQLRLSWEMFFYQPDVLFCPAHTIPLIHPPPSLNPSPGGRDMKRADSSPPVGEVRRGGTYTTLHDVGFEDYPELYDSLSRVYHRLAARLAIKKAARIFTVSEFSKERICQVYDYPREKVTVAYPAVDVSRFSQSGAGDGGVLSDLGLKTGEYFLYVGRLEPKKNILNIIKAYEFLETPHPLVLAGRKVRISDVEEYLGEQPRLRERVRMLDYISEDEKRALLRGASVFLFPTLYEGFGIPILEAQAAGVPVITSNTGSNREVAGERAVIVDPESPYEISKAVRKITDDKSVRSKLIADGTKNLGRFSWEQSAKKILEVMLGNNA